MDSHTLDNCVKIKETFSVITSGQFIRNYEDSSKLNACTISSGGMREINRLAYSYSVVVMEYTGRGKVWESDLIYSDAGINPTRFDMYSYHVNEPEQIYLEDRLSYEVYDSLDFTKILSKYLNTSFIRNSKIDDILS